MKILIDGQEIDCLKNDVKIIWDKAPDENQETHLTATHEGIIIDVFGNDEDEYVCLATMSMEAIYLEELCSS